MKIAVRRRAVPAFVLYLLITAPATARTVPLDSLWPNVDGLEWVYDGYDEENVPGFESSGDFRATLDPSLAWDSMTHFECWERCDQIGALKPRPRSPAPGSRQGTDVVREDVTP